MSKVVFWRYYTIARKGDGEMPESVLKFDTLNELQVCDVIFDSTDERKTLIIHQTAFYKYGSNYYPVELESLEGEDPPYFSGMPSWSDKYDILEQKKVRMVSLSDLKSILAEREGSNSKRKIREQSQSQDATKKRKLEVQSQDVPKKQVQLGWLVWYEEFEAKIRAKNLVKSLAKAKKNRNDRIKRDMVFGDWMIRHNACQRKFGEEQIDKIEGKEINKIEDEQLVEMDFGDLDDHTINTPPKVNRRWGISTRAI
jgi:hypothetical protein